MAEKKYIDAECACEKIRNRKNECENDCYDDCDVGILTGMTLAMQVIDELPAADVAEVKHGCWNNYDTGYDYKWECSCCGHLIDNPYGVCQEQTQTNFCPNCGARMDGVEK